MRTVIIICFLLNGLIANAQFKAMNQDSFLLKLEQYTSEYNAPGVVVAIFTNNRIINLAAHGVRRIDRFEKISVNDKIHLGSNTKAMTAFVAGIMVDKALLKWDTKFFSVFPNLMKDAREAYMDITLEDLLTHRAFIIEFTDEAEFEMIKDFTTDNGIIEDRIAWCKWLVQQDPILEYKQKTYSYSNAGYAMAAAMMEKVSGKTWQELLQEELFDALSLNGGFSWPNEQDRLQPWGHTLEEGTLIPLPPDDEYKIGELLAPAGDVHMSIKDYIKFLQVNMNGLSGNDKTLKVKTYQHLFYSNLDKSVYALGWGVGKVKMGEDKYNYITHSGSGGTYYCNAVIIPELNIGLVIMSNAGDDIHEDGVKVLRTEILEFIRKSIEKI